jgi:hypothetical protein
MLARVGRAKGGREGRQRSRRMEGEGQDPVRG